MALIHPNQTTCEMSIKLAIKKNDMCTLKALYRQGFNLRFSNDKALRFACRKNNLHAVKFLIDVCNADVNFHKYRISSIYDNNISSIIYDHPMTTACENNNIEMMQYLHSKGGDIHVFNDECLRIAAINLNFEIIKWLLEEHNLSLTKKLCDSRFFSDAIFWASNLDGEEDIIKGAPIMKYLISKHEIWETHPETALTFAIDSNDKKLFCDLISKRVYSPKDLNWPLSQSIFQDDIFFMEKLLQIGAVVLEDFADFEEMLCDLHRIDHFKIISRYWGLNYIKETNFSIGWNCPKIHIYIKEMEEKHVEELSAIFDSKLPLDIIKYMCSFLFKPVMESVMEMRLRYPESYRSYNI